MSRKYLYVGDDEYDVPFSRAVTSPESASTVPLADAMLGRKTGMEKRGDEAAAYEAESVTRPRWFQGWLAADTRTLA